MIKLNSTSTTTSSRPADVVGDIAMILHKLAQMRAGQLGEVADEQKQIFEERKLITKLKGELKKYTSNGYLQGAELDAIKAKADELGLELPDLTALQREVGGGYSLKAGKDAETGAEYVAEKVARVHDGLSKVYENFDEKIDLIADSDSARSFRMQQLFNDFSNYESSASKMLDRDQQLGQSMA